MKKLKRISDAEKKYDLGPCQVFALQSFIGVEESIKEGVTFDSLLKNFIDSAQSAKQYDIKNNI